MSWVALKKERNIVNIRQYLRKFKVSVFTTFPATQSGADAVEESIPVMAFKNVLRNIEILSNCRFVLERNADRDLP